jgi:hypothetical protein
VKEPACDHHKVERRRGAQGQGRIGNAGLSLNVDSPGVEARIRCQTAARKSVNRCPVIGQRLRESRSDAPEAPTTTARSTRKGTVTPKPPTEPSA